MGHGNPYWTAAKQAEVPQTMLSDSALNTWVREGGSKAGSWRMLNGAFETWYLLRKSIEQCEDSSQRALMMTELEDAGDAGFGFGVHDLDAAFEHWWGPGNWTDDHSGNYTHTRGIFGSGHAGIQGAKYYWGLQNNFMVGPLFAVNFFDAIDKRMEELDSAMRGHNAEVSKLADAVANKNGTQTGDSLQAIMKHAGKAKKLLFLAPKMNETYGYYGNSIELKGGGSTGVLAGKGANTFLGAVSDIDTFLSVHKAALGTGIFDNRTSTAFAMLTVALGKVPVLGSFYAEMVKNLPGFFAGFQALNKDYYDRIDRAVRDATNY